MIKGECNIPDTRIRSCNAVDLIDVWDICTICTTYRPNLSVSKLTENLNRLFSSGLFYCTTIKRLIDTTYRPNISVTKLTEDLDLMSSSGLVYCNSVNSICRNAAFPNILAVTCIRI